MFEALPVVIPTLRDVARGTLRPAASADAHDATLEMPQMPTAAILLDAAAPGSAPLGALYDELELYLQAAGIGSLRLHGRGRSALAQTLDILAGVTLLRSHGCRRVILVVAAEGAIPSWERSRAETLAGMLEIIRRHHSGTAAELMEAIADLVKTIRGVADSVIGVATILALAPGRQAAGAPAASRRALGPHGPDRRHSPVSGRTTAPSPPPAAALKALALSLAGSESTVSAVSQLYLWCRTLASGTPDIEATLEHAADGGQAPEMREAAEQPKAVTHVRAAGAEFHQTLRWLDQQWSTLVGNLALRTPHSAASILSAMALHPQASEQQSQSQIQGDGQPATAHLTSRAAWKYLDASTRLRWLDLCQEAFSSLREVAPPIAQAD